MAEMPPLTWTPDQLLERVLARERFTLVDTRLRTEFDAGHIEGLEPIPTRNEPYGDVLKVAASEDPRAQAEALVAKPGPSPLPKDENIVVVCARGRTSAVLVEGMRQLGYRAINLAGGMQAWSTATYVRAVVRHPELTIFQIVRPGRGCLSYVIASRGAAVIVDPMRDPSPYQALLRTEQLTAKQVLDTHGHADHVSGGVELAQALGVPYALHPYDAIHPIDMLPATISYEPLHDGQSIPIGVASIEVLHIPGHTLGNLALRVGNYLIAGDSIFIESIARPDLGGRGEAWAALHWRSLRRLLALDDDVQVLPGHFSRLGESNDAGVFVGSLGTLRNSNEGLLEAQKSEREFIEYILSHLPTFPPEYIDIKRVNLGLKQADEDAAAELETGKNICALAHA